MSADVELIQIGKKVRQIREGKKIPRKELSGKSQLKDSYLANLETGRIPAPGLEMLQKIANGLGMEWQELIRDTSCEKALLKRRSEAALVWCRNYRCPRVEREYGFSGNSFLHEYEDVSGTNVRVISYPSYPAFNKHGEQSRYCPACGDKLVCECENCGRAIDGQHTYCSGCGQILWPMQKPDRKSVV